MYGVFLYGRRLYYSSSNDYILSMVEKIANRDINQYSGMRTYLSMKNKENWKEANLLCGKYCFRVGVALLIFIAFTRYIKILPMEWNSLVVSFICIISMLAITFFVNKRLHQ